MKQPNQILSVLNEQISVETVDQNNNLITYLEMQLYLIHLIMQSVCGENTDRKIDGFIYI